MAHREKHRIAAAARRQHRRSLGEVVNPSNRTRNPQGGYWCPGCGERHLTTRAVRLHYLLRHVPAGIR